VMGFGTSGVEPSGSATRESSSFTYNMNCD
jgi:hypothetical protein